MGVEKLFGKFGERHRPKFSSEEKIPIVLEALRGEETISELCRRESIVPTVYYNWSKALLAAYLSMVN